MANTDIERVQFEVPLNYGHLIGNTLRQFAMHGTGSWQAVGYKLANKEGTFGLSGGHNFNYLIFLDGVLLTNDTEPDVKEKVCRFVKSGEDFVCEDMIIKNLGVINSSSLEVCLVYDSGSRSEITNYEAIKRMCPNNADDFVCVPTRHTKTVKFSFDVSPYNMTNEILSVEATAGSIALARDSAMKSLSGLHI